jgi:hypothetical protein
MLIKLPQPLFMADLARALQTPVPATQPAPTTPQPAPQGAGEKAAVTRADNAAREAKNERDRLRRKDKRAADLKATEAAKKQAAAKPKKKKVKKKAAAVPPPVKKRARGRGRPPGSKNKPKVGLSVGMVPAPGVLPRVQKAPSVDGLLTQINLAVSLLNAMPEHARKVVLDAVK